MFCICSLPSSTGKLLSAEERTFYRFLHRCVWKGSHFSWKSTSPSFQKDTCTSCLGTLSPKLLVAPLLPVQVSFKCHLRGAFRDYPTKVKSPWLHHHTHNLHHLVYFYFNPPQHLSLPGIFLYSNLFLSVESILADSDLISLGWGWATGIFPKYLSVISNVQPDLKTTDLHVYWVSPNTTM